MPVCESGWLALPGTEETPDTRQSFLLFAPTAPTTSR